MGKNSTRLTLFTLCSCRFAMCCLNLVMELCNCFAPLFKGATLVEYKPLTEFLSLVIYFATSLSLIISRGQSVLGHVVQAKMWDLNKNPQKWDSSCRVVYRTSVSYFKVKNTPLKYIEWEGKFKRMLGFLLVEKCENFSLQNCPSRNSKFPWVHGRS